MKTREVLTRSGAVAQGHPGGCLRQAACVRGAAACPPGAPRAADGQAAQVGAAQRAPEAPLLGARHHIGPQLRACLLRCLSWRFAARAWYPITVGCSKSSEAMEHA